MVRSGPSRTSVRPASLLQCAASICKVDDDTVVRAFDRCMGRIEKVLQRFGQPVIASRFTATLMHALLYDTPAAIIGDNERVQIQIEPVLHRCAVDFGNQLAGPRQGRSVQPGLFANTDQFIRRLARLCAFAAANMKSQFVLDRTKSALERAEHAGRDAGRVPVHTHDRTKRLKPEWMCEASQHFITTVVMHDRFNNHATQGSHACRKPWRNATSVQR